MIKSILIVVSMFAALVTSDTSAAEGCRRTLDVKAYEEEGGVLKQLRMAKVTAYRPAHHDQRVHTELRPTMPAGSIELAGTLDWSGHLRDVRPVKATRLDMYNFVLPYMIAMVFEPPRLGATSVCVTNVRRTFEVEYLAEDASEASAK